MRISAISLLILCTHTLSAQDYDELIELAYNAYDDSSYVESGKYFEQAFRLNPSAASRDYYNAACSWSLAENTNRSIQYLTKAFELGWDDVSHTIVDADLMSVRDTPAFQALINRYKKPNTLYYDDIVDGIHNSTNNTLTYVDKTIYFVPPDRMSTDITLLSALKEKVFSFDNCNIKLLEFGNLNITGLGFRNCEIEYLSLDNVSISNFHIFDSKINQIGIVNSSIERRTFVV